MRVSLFKWRLPNKGFSLIEIIIMILIVLALGAIGFYRYQEVRQSAWDATAQNLLRKTFETGDTQITSTSNVYGQSQAQLRAFLEVKSRDDDFVFIDLDPARLPVLTFQGKNNPLNILVSRERDEAGEYGKQFTVCNQSQSARWFCRRGHSEGQLLAAMKADEVLDSVDAKKAEVARSWGNSLPLAYCNLPGTKTPAGASCPDGSDICSNISGPQDILPYGFYLDKKECISTINVEDVCENIDDDQTSVPSGYQQLDDFTCNALSEAADICSNIDGTQVSVPTDYSHNDYNECVQATIIEQEPSCTEELIDCGGGGIAPQIADPPAVIITSPTDDATTQNPDIRLTFVISGGTPTDIECRADKKAWEDCTSGYIVSGLSVGIHLLEVRVVNINGEAQDEISITINSGGHTHGSEFLESETGLELIPILFTIGSNSGITDGDILNSNKVLNIHSVKANEDEAIALSNFNGQVGGFAHLGAQKIAYARDYRHIGYLIRNGRGYLGVMNALKGAQQYNSEQGGNQGFQWLDDLTLIAQNEKGVTRYITSPVTHQFNNATDFAQVDCRGNDIDDSASFVACINKTNQQVGKINLTSGEFIALTRKNACDAPVASAGYIVCQQDGKIYRGSDNKLNETLTAIYPKDNAINTQDKNGITWAVSPDGTRVALISAGDDGTHQIEIMDMDGDDLKVVVENPNKLVFGDVAFSPNGNHLAYRCGESLTKMNICLADTRTAGQPTVIYSPADNEIIGELAWAADNYYA